MPRKRKETTLTYSWADGSRISLDANIAGNEIETMRAKTPRGNLPRRIVMFAQSKKSPLHDYFEWENDIAGEKWRINQASHLIISLQVIIVEKPNTAATRALVYIGGKGQYSPIRSVLADPLAREQLFTRARTEMASFRRRYSTLEELSSVFLAMEEAHLEPVA